MQSDEHDDPGLPYSVHESYRDGETAEFVSRHATLEEAIAVAKERLDKKRVIYHRR